MMETSFIQIVIFIVSLIGIFTLYLRHKHKSKWLNEDLPNEMQQNLYTKSKFQDWDKLFYSRRQWFHYSFWLEALIFLICPIPYWDMIIVMDTVNSTNHTSKIPVYYLLSDFILGFMLIRCYFLFRAIFNYNLFTDLYSKKLCKSYGFTANLRFTYKCLLKSDPGLTVMCTLLISVIILAYLLRIFELPY